MHKVSVSIVAADDVATNLGEKTSVGTARSRLNMKTVFVKYEDSHV